MLAKRLVELRKASKLTQAELSEKIHISRDTYAQYEIGRRSPDYETLKLLASFYDVSIDYILGQSNEPKQSPKSILEEEWPEVANILRRNGKRLTPEDKKRIAKIIKAAVEDD